MGGDQERLQLYEQIRDESHPAVFHIRRFLESQAHKDIATFTAYLQHSEPFFLNLPGGHIVTNPEELIKRHTRFYESPEFACHFGELQHGMGNNDFFICNVHVNVTLPGGLKRSNYIDMTFVKNSKNSPAWIPVRLVNTVIEP